MKTIMLKHIVLIFTFLMIGATAKSQQTTSTKAWLEDLDYLQQRVHQDFPFLFKKVEQKTWDAAVAAFRKEIPNLQEHEVKVGMARMVSLFAYGHTQIPFSTLAREAVLPVNLYHFKDGIYIEGVHKAHAKTLGAKVIKVGNLPVDQALAKIRPVVPVENDSYFKAYGLRFLTVPSVLHAQGVIDTWNTKVTLTLEKDGKTFDYTFPSIALKEMSRDYNLTIPNAEWLSVRRAGEPPLYLKHLNEKYFYYEYLTETKTLYVRQSSVFDDPEEKLKDFYVRLFEFIDTHEVDKLVYDVRLNGGGNNYNNKPFIKGIMARPQLNTHGKFFYIIGRNTFSACQNLTNEVENYTEAILVGEPTAENKNFYGDTKKVTLPNSGINAYLSFAWWQDMPQWENAAATTPVYEETMTFEQYRTNADPVLELVLSIDAQAALPNPMDHFTQLFMDGKIEQLRTDAKRIINDPKYQHFPFEEEFRKVGQLLMEQSQYESAAFIYQMFIENYPENADFWNGLGTALKALGKGEEADKAFAKATSLKD